MSREGDYTKGVQGERDCIQKVYKEREMVYKRCTRRERWKEGGEWVRERERGGGVSNFIFLRTVMYTTINNKICRGERECVLPSRTK